MIIGRESSKCAPKEETVDELQKGLSGGLEEEGYEDEELGEMKDFYKECLDFCELYSDSEGYLHEAYGVKPNFLDYENVVHIEKIKPRLEIIFDAFEEICNRMEK